MSRPLAIRYAVATATFACLAMFVSVDRACAQTRTYGAASATTAQPQRYRGGRYETSRYDTSRQGGTRFYAPRHDGRDAPGPLIITPGQIFSQHDNDGADDDDDAARRDAGKTRPRMEHWVLRPVPGRHMLTKFQPAITGDDAVDKSDIAADDPPTPPQELLEPADEVAADRDSGEVEYYVDDRCTSRRRLGPYPDVGNYDDAYGRQLASGRYAADYGAQGFLYGTPGNTWWDFYGYPYVGARMSWASPYGGFGYPGFGYGGYGYGGFGYGGYGYFRPRYYGYYGYNRPYGFSGYGGGFYRGWGRFGYRGSYHW